MQANPYAIILHPGRMTAVQLDDREADELRDAGQTILPLTLLGLVQLAGQSRLDRESRSTSWNRAARDGIKAASIFDGLFQQI